MNYRELMKMKFGAIVNEDTTDFKVWAPNRNNIDLLLYDRYNDVKNKKYQMQKDENGVFSCKIEENLHGKFYTYLVENTNEVTDPYSFSASVNSIKSAAIDLRKTDPVGFRTHKRPKNNYKNAIICELSIKDYTINANSGVENRGKFLGLSEKGTSFSGVKTGLDNLIELGVTHVHLLPIYDFISVDEYPEKFFNEDNYNWGYDPELYNTPEGSYSTNSMDPELRIKELKEMIMALHENGISVVLDVVYNHTYKGDDSNFEVLNPGYYHRFLDDGTYSNGSWTGNEFASEKEMGRKFIIDSLKYWQDEFMVDGFRFDLMGLIDKKTIYEAVEVLRNSDDNCLIYGEPWLAGESTLPIEARTVFDSQRGKNFAVFNDRIRDAIKGRGDDFELGYVQGNFGLKNQVETGMLGSIDFDLSHKSFALEPFESINYVNCHDNLIITDRFIKGQAKKNIYKDQAFLANAIIILSQGIVFFHEGNEFLREKYMVCNSYNSSNYINSVDWSYKVKNYEYFKEFQALIGFRKKNQKFFDLTREEIIENVKLLENLPEDLIGYEILRDSEALLIIHSVSEISRNVCLDNISSHYKKFRRFECEFPNNEEIKNQFLIDSYKTVIIRMEDKVNGL